MVQDAKPARRSPLFKLFDQFQGLFDLGAILAWGILLLHYWQSGKMNLLLHPNYIWLAYSAGFFLLGLAAVKIAQFVRLRLNSKRKLPPSLPHLSLFPPGWSSLLLLAVAIFGLQFTPRPFSSQVAIDRGVTETLSATRAQPQSFRANAKPENRSLIDWIRTLNVYPEPDAYTGQKVSVEGFAIHVPELPSSYLKIGRFVITCCAADAYPVALPVKLTDSRSAYPADEWFRVEGQMITETLNGKRQLVIEATKLTKIPTPKNPYES